MLPGIPGSAICVQSFDDSLNSAIRITYRISLRSSSLREPRYPSLKVVSWFYNFHTSVRCAKHAIQTFGFRVYRGSKSGLIVDSFSGFPPTPSSSSAQETRNLPAKEERQQVPPQKTEKKKEKTTHNFTG